MVSVAAASGRGRWKAEARMSRSSRTLAASLLLGSLLGAVAACGSPGSSGGTGGTSSASAAAGSASTGGTGGTGNTVGGSGGVTGTVETAGSSTVGPLTTSIGERFHAYTPAVTVTTKITSTGAGLAEFCKGQLDIANASRAMEQAETDACKAAGVEPHQILVANDGISVIVPAADRTVTCLTTAELKKLWEPDATGRVTTWKQVRESLPATPLSLYGPDKDSGTLDFFTTAITGGEKKIRADYAGSEDDMATVRGVHDHPGGVGFLGLSYLRENPDLVKGVAVDGGKGCVSPTADTVLDGSYAPLSRPLYIYVNGKRLKERPQVKAFVEYYVQWARNVAIDSDLVPVTETQRLKAKEQLAEAVK